MTVRCFYQQVLVGDQVEHSMKVRPWWPVYSLLWHIKVCPPNNLSALSKTGQMLLRSTTQIYYSRESSPHSQNCTSQLLSQVGFCHPIWSMYG